MPGRFLYEIFFKKYACIGFLHSSSELGTRYFESSSDDGDRLREIYHEAARQVLRREEEGEEDEEEGESRKRPFRKCEIL